MQPNEPLPDFGEPLDPSVLLDFASIDPQDIESALEWFDANASEQWQGTLEAPPYTPRIVL